VNWNVDRRSFIPADENVASGAIGLHSSCITAHKKKTMMECFKNGRTLIPRILRSKAILMFLVTQLNNGKAWKCAENRKLN
jgi:hypothetical protein